MGDLYFDDIEDRAYTDKMILDDVRALVKSGQREGTLLDYKSDISDKDTWPASVAAFANTFGGLIIFGIDGKNDQPRRITGFNPKGVEVRTKLTSMVIDRVQPRPDISVRVVTFDDDPTKEIALLRVSEGNAPPYMHSKGQEHRLYVRIGAQKAEADYMQLSSLLEKRARINSPISVSADDIFGPNTDLRVLDPPHSNMVSRYFIRFILSPNNIAGRIRLTFETERKFKQCLSDILLQEPTDAVIRSKDVTVFPWGAGPYLEQRFGLAARGGLGFISRPFVNTGTGVFFQPEEFGRFLFQFLVVSSLFYERTLRFFGTCLLFVNLELPPSTGIISNWPTLFLPPLSSIRSVPTAQMEIALSPLSVDRLQEYLDAILIDIARPNGSVLDPKSRKTTQRLAETFVERLTAARLK